MANGWLVGLARHRGLSLAGSQGLLQGIVSAAGPLQYSGLATYGATVVIGLLWRALLGNVQRGLVTKLLAAATCQVYAHSVV